MKELNFSYDRKIEKEKINLKCYAYHVGAFNYNWHEDVECLVVINGSLEACVNGKIYKLSKDDIIFFNTNEGHATLAKERETIALVLHFSPKILNSFARNRDRYSWQGATDEFTRNSDYAKEIRKSIVNIISSFEDDSLENKMLRSLASDEIILNSLLHFAEKEEIGNNEKSGPDSDEVMRKIIKYLDDNYREKISLQDLADLVGYHPNYTSEIVSKNLGISFTEYLQRKRLSNATKDLKQSEKKISDIAYDHGFSNVRSFNNAFRESFGRSPSEYRDNLDKETLEIDAQFKKVFLSEDNPHWLRAKRDWSLKIENKEEDEIKLRTQDIERDVYKKIIENLEKEMENL